MQVFKAFFKILWKQKIVLIIYVITFLTCCVCFASTGKRSAQEGFSEYGYNVVIEDEDQSVLSVALKEYLAELNNLKEIENTEEKIQDALYARTIVAAITIPKGFEEKVLNGEEEVVSMMTIPGTRYSTGVESQISRFMRPLSSYILAGMSIEEAAKAVKSTLDVESTVVFLNSNDAKAHDFIYFYFLYASYIMVAITMVGIGPAIIRFRRKDVNDRNNVSAYPLWKRSFEQVAAMFSTATAIYLLMLILAFCLCGMSLFATKGLLMILNGLSFLTVALAITFLTASFALDNNILNMIGNVVGLGMTFLGGVFVPMEIMGKTMENIARFVPTYWNVKVLEELDKTGADMSRVWGGMLIQLGFAVAITFVTLAIRKARKSE